MLNEYLDLYSTQASHIEDWKKINKNKLCELYIANEEDPVERDAYFSALVARYWPAMTRLYTHCKFGVTEEECYQWLIDSIMYALKHRAWLDPNSPLCGDPNGPDKVINRCLKSRRLTYYQLLNKDKRVANLNAVSIEAAEGEFGDSATDSLGLVEESNSVLLTAVNDLIYNCASSGDIFISILLDMILNEDILENNPDRIGRDSFSLISKKKVLRILTVDSESYIASFCHRNRLPENALDAAKSFIATFSSKRLNILLPKALSALRTAKMRRLLYK